MRRPSCSSEVLDRVGHCSSCGIALSSSEMAAMADTSGSPNEPGSRSGASSTPSSSGGTRRSVSSSQSPGRFAPGTIFTGRYRIIGLLGTGGMAVYGFNIALAGKPALALDL